MVVGGKNVLTPIRVLMPDIKKILKELDINNLEPETRKELKKLILQKDLKQKHSKIQNDFMHFVKHMWPEFIEGDHHKIIAEKFNNL